MQTGIFKYAGSIHIKSALIILLILLAYTGVWGVQQEQIEKIALTDIARKSEETLNYVFSVKKLLDTPDEIQHIAEKLPSFLKNLERSEKDRTADNQQSLTPSRIAEQERVWLTLETILSGWLPVVQERSRVLDEKLKTLQQKEAVWQSTLKEAKQRKAPAALLERVRSVLQTLKETEHRLKKVLNEALTLQSRLAEADLKVKETLNILRRQMEQAGATLLTLDKPPIWKAFKTGEVSVLFVKTLRDGVASRMMVIREYTIAFYSRFIFQILFFIALSLIFIALKRWETNHAVPEDEKPNPHKILNWPFATALLFTLWLTPSFHPQAPVFISEISYFIMLFPLARIIPRLLFQFYRGILYFFMLAFFLDQLGSLVISGSLLQRLLSLVLSLAALVLIFRLIRSRRISETVGEKRLAWFIKALSRLALGLLVVSAVANVVGAFSLAQFLVRGVLFSGFMATVLLVGVLALNQLWDIFLHLEFTRSYRSFAENTEFIRSRFNQIVYWIALYWWLVSTLDLFHLYNGLKKAVLSVVGFEVQVGSLSVTLGDVLIFSLTIYVSVLLSRFIRFFLEEDVLRKVKLPRGVAGSISMLTHYVILAIGFTIAMSAAGIEWSRFAIIAGALGVGIGFGLQDVVNNFVSGLILIFERPIKLGDVVELDELRGNVKRIGIRSSTIRTFEGAEVIVPNSHLISNKVVNWTLSDRMRRVTVPVGVAYGTDPKKVLKLLENIAQKHPDVREKPEPMAIFTGFGDSSLDFELLFWTNNYDAWLPVRTDISIRVNEALAKAGIEIPFPQRDIHIVSEPEKDKPEAAKTNPTRSK